LKAERCPVRKRACDRKNFAEIFLSFCTQFAIIRDTNNLLAVQTGTVQYSEHVSKW